MEYERPEVRADEDANDNVAIVVHCKPVPSYPVSTSPQKNPSVDLSLDHLGEWNHRTRTTYNMMK